MDEQMRPNLQVICRLCLKENEGTVSIFSKENNLDKFASLSIPMRIMACAALEVQASDGLPSKICADCRLQLEKSYYFRKQSQVSDAKLRKHIRLLGMGRKSKVFIKKDNDEDDDDDDELEFKDSLDFITEQEGKEKERQQLQLTQLREELQLQYDQQLRNTEEALKIVLMDEFKTQNEQELKKYKEAYKIKCREELKPLVREEVRNELREEVQKELEETMRKQLKEECLAEAKESLRDEVRDECRQLEMKSLLSEIETFIMEKKHAMVTPDEPINKIAETPTATKSPKSLACSQYSPVKKISLRTRSKQPKEMVKNTKSSKKEDSIKNEITLSGSAVAEEMDAENPNEESDSDGNFLIYDTDEGYELEKTITDNKTDYTDNVVTGGTGEDEYVDSNMTYMSGDEVIVTNDANSGDEIMVTNEASEPTSTTTSYHIEDTENGEIKFFKKSDETVTTDEANVEHVNDGNVMIINFPESIQQDQLDMTDYVDDYEKAVKSLTMKKPTSNKSNKTSNKAIKSSNSPTSSSSTLTTTVEATYLTKTYVNPLQRITDTPKIFKCGDCPMVFSTKPSLERHLRSHRKVEQTGVTFQCPECQIVVSCNSALRRHMFVHSEEKPFSCDVCGKAFVQREILKRHMQTHTGIKPYPCPHCDRAFAQRINLTQHINRNHLAEPRIQQHPCHLCTKRFNHASGLSRHLATHSGVAFQCSECERTFGDRSSIKRHIANMHNKDKHKG